MRQSYGGYLPLDQHEGPDWFTKWGEEQVLRTNSGKSAIFHALNAAQFTKVYVPYYICPSVIQMLQDSAYPYEYYRLTEKMLPDLPPTNEDELLIFVNYFGILNQCIPEMLEKFPQLLIDNCHAFYSPPVIRKNVYNAYSCRKFFGVADGGYLVAKDIPHITLEAEEVRDHFQYLVSCAEVGPEETYAAKNISDQYFRGRYLGMSKVTESMLAVMPYEEVRDKRQRNFNILHKALASVNQFDLSYLSDLNDVLYLYPLFLKNDQRSDFVARKIFVPTLWKHLTNEDEEGSLEQLWSKNIHFLPIDQRYSAQDMIELARQVLEIVATNNWINE